MMNNKKFTFGKNTALWIDNNKIIEIKNSKQSCIDEKGKFIASIPDEIEFESLEIYELNGNLIHTFAIPNEYSIAYLLPDEYYGVRLIMSTKNSAGDVLDWYFKIDKKQVFDKARKSLLIQIKKSQKMKNINLFFSKLNHSDLKKFSDYFFREIGVSEHTERESSHYVDGHYFTGAFGNFTFKIAHSDENYEDLDYWISINENNHPSEYTMEIIEEKIKEKFLPSGYRIAKFLDFGKNTEKRIDYI